MQKPSTGRLRPFRLEEVPLEIRIRAAKTARVRELPDDDADPRDRLLAVLAAPAFDEEREKLVRAASTPSDRVYWISAAAWAKVMGDSAWATVMNE